MGFISHRGFESRPLRPLRSAKRPRTGGRYARSRLAPVAQLDRASVYGTEGHRFESCRARSKSPAQQGFFVGCKFDACRTLSPFVSSASQLAPRFRAMRTLEPPTGHVFRRDGARRSTWYAKYRLPDGRQVQKRIGPAWTERGRPAAGHYTKRTAEAWLREVLDEARRGTLPGLVQTGATFADAAAEFLRYVEHDRSIKPSTLTDYRSIVSAHLVPAFGAMRVEEVTPEKIERWRATVASADGSPLSNRTKQAARPAARRLPSGAEGLRPAEQPGRGNRASPATLERRHRGLRCRGGVRARARGHL